MRTHLYIDYEKYVLVHTYNIVQLQLCPHHCVILYNIMLLLVLILSVTLSTTETNVVWWKSTEYGYYDIAYGYT
jgi:hypothetical protein